MDEDLAHNTNDVIDMYLNGTIVERRYAYVMVVCQAKGDLVGGETRVLTNVDGLAAHTLLKAAVNELDGKMGNA
jgi:hypothetical protein